jgi:hypothetical protein
MFRMARPLRSNLPPSGLLKPASLKLRSVRFHAGLVASFLLLALSVAAVAQTDTAKRGRKYKAPPPTSRFEVTVLRATNGKPIENASVIFHPLEDGHNNGNMELKTNDEGKAVIDLLEIGSDVRLQIIAPGFQTYGEDYKIDKDNIAVQIKMKRPAAQYSIYKKSEGQAAPGETKPGEAEPAKPEAKPEDTKPETDPKDPAKPQDPPPAKPE